MRFHFFVLISLFLFLALFVLAQEELPGITFPVAELGNCGSRAECEAYCDLPENMEACLDFAEAHNLISKKEIEMARKMLALGMTAGPGGCRGQAECAAYCDDISHIEECLTFAEKYGLISPEELEEGRKVAAAIKKGIKPPNCRNKTECDVCCRQPENMEECLTFAEATGFITPEEAAMIRKTGGRGPGGCRGEEACEAYCENPAHMEE